MIMTATAELAVAEAAMDDKDSEVVGGIKEAKMAVGIHGRTIMRLGARLQMFVEQQQLGDFYSPDTTFLIGEEDRLPDLAFISNSRLPEDRDPVGKWEIAPDLAIEVVSPTDLHRNIQTKLRDYFSAGVREVWLVEPEFKIVTVYQSPTRNVILTEDDELTSTVLPGFRCDLREIFASPVKS
jgi:Uma2 family endonuclease